MFIGYFTERPYQGRDRPWYGGMVQDLQISNSEYDPVLGADLYNRYIDEKIYAEEVGFDGLILNEHHSTPFCMGGVLNIEAAILARVTSKAKIVMFGNILPIWDDPLWLAEQLAEIDLISRGRLVSGWVRGTGRESFVHNAQPPYNWERFQEAHEFILKAWTDPGPFRWEGEHYDYRYVNPWMKPFQTPHPPIWIPGVYSKNTVEWAAERRYPYFMLSTQLEPTKQSFDFYTSVAKEEGYEAGPQHRGFLFKVHVDETEELAYETGRKFLEGPGNIFLEGKQISCKSCRAEPAGLGIPYRSAAHCVHSTYRSRTGSRRRRSRRRGPVLAGRRSAHRGGSGGGATHHVREAAGVVPDHHRYSGHRHQEGAARLGDLVPRSNRLLGRRRRHDPR